MRGRCRALGGAQLCRTRARIGRDLRLAGRDRTLGQDIEAGRGLRHFGQMPRARGNLAALGQEILDDAVFQRMEGDDDEPAAWLQHALGGRERFMQLVEFFVDEDAQRLERTGCGVNFVGLGAHHFCDEIGQRPRGRDRRFLARGDDGARDAAGVSLLAVDVDDVGQIRLGRLGDDIGRGRP